MVVGIDDYLAGATPRPGDRWKNLHGAARDARAFEELLQQRYDFPPSSVTLLLDRVATRRAILDALEQQLAAPARPGDEVVFFYAGHGSQVPNPGSDEPDKMDESLVPADSNEGAEDLRDKELARIFNRILDRGARLTAIFDSCNSGSLARGLPLPQAARFLPPATRGVMDAAPTGGKPEERGALVLSATRDFEQAIEVLGPTGEPHGAFSLALMTAVHRSPPGEPAEVTFLRARALLQTSDAFQQPVLAGTAERRQAPLFGDEESQHAAGLAVAVRRVEAGGRVLLQGGWAHGLRRGVELEVRGDAALGPPVRLRVTRILGPAAAEARVVGGRSDVGRRPVRSGDVATLSAWALADEPTLRVWIPNAGDRWPRAVALARELRALASSTGLTWVIDPVKSTPAFVLHWDGGWWLTARGEPSRPLGMDPRPRDVLRQASARDGRPSSLFVQLPAPPALATALALGAGSPNDAVERSPRNGAHYQLVGRLAGDEADFAWVRPAVGAEDAAASPLPTRSDWCSTADRGCVPTLTEAALRLNKIRSWLTLEPPPGADFPYRLWLVDDSGAATRTEPLRAGERYRPVARAPRPLHRSAVKPRHLYVFSIDSFGNSTLLFPRVTQGSVENRFPIAVAAQESWPAEIRLGSQAGFRVRAPFGTDTFFLLSSEEPIPNPWVLQFGGVRSRGPRGETALEELLSQTGSSARGGPPDPLPINWSLERLTLQTVGLTPGSR